MDWHVWLLLIALCPGGFPAYSAWRLHGARHAMHRRANLVAAREAAFVRILQRLATAHTLDEVLLETVRAIEGVIPDCIGSILMIKDGKIRNGAAPGLPSFYNGAI